MSEADGIRRRLTQVREDKVGRGRTVSKMARALGLPDGTYRDCEQKGTVSHRLAGALFRTFPDVNPTWLFTGEGKPYRGGSQALAPFDPSAIPPDEALDLAVRRVKDELADRQRTAIYVTPTLDIIGAEDALERAGGAAWAQQFIAVPLMHDEVAAGVGREVDNDAIDGYCVVYREWVDRPEDMRCLRVAGDSMEPILANGSIVGVDISRCLAADLHGKLVVARTEEGLSIKWLEVTSNNLVILRPQNPAYQSAILTPEARNPILGQIVWAWAVFR